MLPFNVNGRAYSLDRWTQQLPNIDLVRWLEGHPVFPKVYWKETESDTTYAAVGNLLSFSQVPRISDSSSEEIRFYGGMRFSERLCLDDATWEGFPKVCFWLPEIELSHKDGQTEAVCYGLNGRTRTEIGSDNKLPGRERCISFLERHDTPNFAHWGKKVQTVLEALSTGELNKLVLARKTILQFLQPLSPWPCLDHLIRKALRATLFAFQLNPSLCFLGASPEKLFERKGSVISTDVVASTRPRGATPEQDLQFERELLSGAKEQREFQIVKTFLKNTISPFSRKLEWEGQDRILKTSHVQHIYNRLSASIKKEISDEEIILALHPTPSLGGFPTKKALAILQHIEPFDRGWYGAPVGVIGSHRASLYVAIRSALIQNRTMHLFAGTGVVEGSIAEQEWEELEDKIRPFTELFV
jgi:menaquinone-specific isochorismate synthase